MHGPTWGPPPARAMADMRTSTRPRASVRQYTSRQNGVGQGSRLHHRNVKMVPVRLSESGTFGGGYL